MKKVIEQGKGYLDVQYLTETISVYQRFGLNPKGVFILIDKPKAREVAKAIDPKYQETEDENKILKNQIELIFKNANNKIESLESELKEAVELVKECYGMMSTHPEPTTLLYDKIREFLTKHKSQ